MQLKSIWTFCVSICHPFRLWCYQWAKLKTGLSESCEMTKLQQVLKSNLVRSVGYCDCCVIRYAVWGTVTFFYQVRSVGYCDCCVIRYAVWGTVTVVLSGTQCGVLWLLCYQVRSVRYCDCFVIRYAVWGYCDCCVIRYAVWDTVTVVISGTQCGVLWLLCYQVRSVGYCDCCVIRYAVWGTMTVTVVLLSGTQCGVLWRLCCYQVRSVGYCDCNSCVAMWGTMTVALLPDTRFGVLWSLPPSTWVSVLPPCGLPSALTLVRWQPGTPPLQAKRKALSSPPCSVSSSCSSSSVSLIMLTL